MGLRTRATLHGTLMVVGGAFTATSFVLRQGGAADGAAQTTLLVIGFLVIAAGAFVGGDVVFVLGNMVSRHAFRVPGRSGSAWTPGT
jgi:hypothetical protein